MAKLDAVLASLKKLKTQGKDSWAACCPAHDDRNPSLSITATQDGKLLLHCHGGCKTEDIVQAMGLTMSDLMPDKPGPVRPRLTTTYDYLDERGELLFQVCRYEPKGFRVRQPDNQGGWIQNMQGIRRVLYNLPSILTAIQANESVFVVEGEKDADALIAVGFPATTNPGGANKWLPEYNETFRGADVVIIPDDDVVGRQHAARVAGGLLPIVASLRIVELNDAC